MTPLVSVVIATYNRSNVLPYSIGSVLGQTLGDYEVLVIGDGCTDDSQSVVEGIGDERVQWHNLPTNSGHQSQPNNHGLQLARGKYISYLGHDDLWLPRHLELLAEQLEKGADIAFGLTLTVNPIEFSRSTLPSQPEYSAGMWIPPTGTAHRKSVTDTIGGWRHYREITRSPEADLWLRAFEAGYKFACANRVTAVKFPGATRKDVYRIRPCEEQATWFARMRDEADFEVTELAQTCCVLTRIAEKAMSPKPYRVLLRELASETQRRLAQKWRRLPARNGGVIDEQRAYKGLEPNEP